VLDAGRDQGAVLGVGHGVVAGGQPFLGGADTRVSTGLATLHELPRGRDVDCVHELVHHVADRPHPAGQQPPQPDPAQRAGRPRGRQRDDPRVPGGDQRDPHRQQPGGGAGEVHRPEVAEERVPDRQVPRVRAVEEGVPAVPGPESVGGPVAAHVPMFEDPVVERRARAALNLGPHLVTGHVPVVLVPAPLVPDERGRLEREHPVPHNAAVAHHAGDLAQVRGGDGHAVGQEVPHTVLAAQPREHRREGLPVGVERGLVRRAGEAAAAEHQRVEVGGERHPAQPGPPARAEHQLFQVVIVDVAVGEAHRLPPVRAHDRQRGGVIIGVEQGHLAADQLGVRPRPPLIAQQAHLRPYLGEGVRAVDPHLVGVTVVVAGGAGQVALGEHPVGALAADRVPSQQLPGRACGFGQLGPAPCQRGGELRVRRPRRAHHLADPRHSTHSRLPSA